MKKILVPTDFSPLAKNSVLYALSLAKLFKSELIIFHSDNFPLDELSVYKEEVDEKMLTDHIGEISYMSSSKMFNSLTLNEVVQTNNIGLIVMTTNDEDVDPQKIFFGRNATEIAEHAVCPVLIIPSNYKYSTIDKLIYASDLHFIDQEIIKVIALAKLLGTSIEILFVSPIFPDLKDVEKMDFQKKLEQLKQKHNFNEISYTVEKTKRDNQFISGITEFLSRHDHDLLIMFHNHDTDFEEMVSSSHTEQMVEQMKIPLLIYPKA